MDDATDIVSTHWLNEHLNEPIIRILDVTLYSSKNAFKDYAREHIPGAVYFDLFKDVNNTDVYSHSLPEATIFEKNVRAAGVNNDSHVVVYDSEGKSGFLLGSRAWFTFHYVGHNNVSILDGGLQKWKSDGFSVTAEIPQINEGNVKVNVNSSLLTTFDFMKENLKSKETQVLDSRLSEDYLGKKEDKKTGHYPGAINIPSPLNLLDSSNGTFKKSNDLKAVFREHGVDTGKPVVAMCHSGITACSLLLAAKLAGVKHVALYLAGFLEWKSRADESAIEQS